MMKSLIYLAQILLLGGSGVAQAAERTIPTVLSASAGYSPTEKHTMIVRARVQLDNGCWSNPHFRTPDSHATPDAQGAVPITVVADSSEGSGVMCAMHVMSFDVPALHWTRYPNTGLKAVKVIGGRDPVIAAIRKTDPG